MPSLFTNDKSKGPLYDYWKDRSAEEKTQRDQRIQEAKLRSQGFTPMDPTYGPSSRDSYQARAAGGGPPGYESAGLGDEGGVEGIGMGMGEGNISMSLPPRRVGSPRGGGGDELPAYNPNDATPEETSSSASSAPPPTGDDHLLSAEKEKARLAALEARHSQNQIDSDAAIAQTLSNDDQTQAEITDPEGKGKEPDRRKSTAGKVGRWFADAASGYTKKQERW